MSDPDAPDEGHVPVSVRLGEVVPPEDPEDWTRPLTWVAALGMLAAPLVTLGWFALVPPGDGARALPATHIVAVALAGGAAATGATQQGAARAAAATLGAGLFGALLVVMVGGIVAGEPRVGVAPPSVSHAFVAAVAGAAGVVAAAVVAWATARPWSRPARFAAAAAVGILVAVVSVATLMP